jgi:diadenosine tetraphosphate (Ap4A) HIT family hydrolase
MGWDPGNVIVRRDRWRGRTWHATAMYVVEDDGELLVTYTPPGSEVAKATTSGTDLVAQLATGDWELERTARFNHTLGAHRRGDSYSICLFWSEAWEFLGWYVNLEAPHRWTSLGVDTCDHHLDIVVAADRSGWSWKDEDHLAAAIDLGLYTEVDAGGLRREGERAAYLLTSDSNPWHRWLDWRPPPAWSTAPPTFPTGWDDAPTGRLGFTVRKREPCPFCQNIAGIASRVAGLPSVVAEDDLTYTFVNPVPLGGMDGHVLVVPRRHVETIFDLREDEEAALALAIGRVARAIRKTIDPDGVLVVQRNGVAAQQDVPHVHFHVIPRDGDAPFPPTHWVERTPIDERHAIASKLRHSIG